MKKTMAEAGTDTMSIMNKRIFNFAVLAAAAGILAACSSFEEIPAVATLTKAETQAVDSITVTFTATLEQPEGTTRTSLDASKWRVKWTAGDKVTVIGKGTYKSGQTTNTRYFQVPGTVSNISDDGYSATISASLPSKTSSGSKTITYTGDYYSVYPAISENSTQSNNANVSTALKSEQTATASTFANNVNLAAAKSTDKSSFHFQNLCALLSFTLDTDVKSATLTPKSGTGMTGGTATIDFSSNVPAISAINKAVSSVTLTGGLAKDTKYYFVVYPGEYQDGFTLEFEDNGGRYASMTSTKSLPLAAKDNVFLGDIKVPADRWTKLNKISAVGVYNTNCEVEYEYKPYNDQLVWSVTPSVNGFRIQKMDSRQFINIAGLPGTFTDGDSFTITVNENLLTDQGSEFTDKVKVFSTDNGIVRLKGEKHNYIIQTK